MSREPSCKRRYSNRWEINVGSDVKGRNSNFNIGKLNVLGCRFNDTLLFDFESCSKSNANFRRLLRVYFEPFKMDIFKAGSNRRLSASEGMYVDCE